MEKTIIINVVNSVLDVLNSRVPAYMDSAELVSNIIASMENELKRTVDLTTDEDNDLFDEVNSEINDNTNYVSDGVDSGYTIQKSAEAVYAFVKNGERVDSRDWDRCVEIECEAYISLADVDEDIKSNNFQNRRRAYRLAFDRLLGTMTQREFREFIGWGLPRRTLENWCAGTAVPPQYVYGLMKYKVENEK